MNAFLIAVLALLAGASASYVGNGLYYGGKLSTLELKLAVTADELNTEKLERKVFSDGMVGCFDRLGKDKPK